MKSILAQVSCLLPVLVALASTACGDARVDRPASDKLLAKHEPLEGYLDLRLGVGDDFSYETYRRSVKSAVRSELASRNTPPAGFSESWTVQGPNNLGGRVNVLAVDPRNENVAYLGFSRGGLWRTDTDARTWWPVTEDLPFPTIGAIAIDSATGRIWIGTGDPNISGYFYVGDGVYYSDDEGATWTQSGLENSGVINKLLVDPNDPQTLYAAVMGRPYEASADRGVYKTTDGGASWRQVHFVAPEAGISDLWMDPRDADVLYACAWPRVRRNLSSFASGDAALLFKSTDAGTTWQSLYDSLGYELPASRLGFAIAPSNPDRLYLSVTGDNLRFSEFYRSDDAGLSWTMVCDAESPGLEIGGVQRAPFSGFGWFFGQTRVDPNDPDHVWMLGVGLYESFDGGATWDIDEDTDFSFFVHADKHALEVTPNGNVWLGTDGGAYRRPLSDTLWEDIEDIPTNMFYRVADSPFDTLEYAGGMQDNGTAIGGVATTGEEWFKAWGGDGFQPVYHRGNADEMLVETQRGRLWYLDLVGGFTEEISPPHQDEQKSWDMPVAHYYDEEFEETILLTGSNVSYTGIFEDLMFWEREDQLLTSDPDNSRLVVTAAHIAEDRTQYLGTSEGRLWRRADGEFTWQQVGVNTAERYISDVTSLPEDPNSLYLTMTEYRDGDTSPYILHSEDGGATWFDLQGDLPQIAINAVLAIPNTRDSLIVVATDAGVYASIDAGTQYWRLGQGMTNVPVMDLAFDSVSHTLIAATFGRSVQTYELDSIELVRPTISSTRGTPRELPSRDLLVSPNPATDYVDVRLALTEVDKPTQLTLHDMSGRTLTSVTYPPGRLRLSERVSLPEGLPSGTYLLKVQNRHTVSTAKVNVR